MTIRILLDQGLPRSSAAILRDRGFDALHVSEVALESAPDHAILEYAATTNRTVITLDSDFHMLMATLNLSSPSVIRIRIEGLKGNELADLVGRVIAECAQSLLQGSLISVTESNLRIRHLPLQQHRS